MNDEGNKNAPINFNLSNKEILDQKKRIKKILLVENDVITQDVIRFFLKDLYSVDVASNAETAMEFVHTNKYNAILMDINLGKGKSGIEITKDIRKVEGYENIPIIAETAFAMRGDKEEFLAAGCDYYIAKPFSKEEIRNIILAVDVENPQ